MTRTPMTAVPLPAEAVLAAAKAAVNAIPPAWPLDSSVAVNPYLGQIGESLEATAARLARVAGVRTTMPRSWFRAQMARGAITRDDLAAALSAASPRARPTSVDALEAATNRDVPAPAPLPTVAELAAKATGVDWPGIVAERIGAWAGSYFDEGQALWSVPHAGAFAVWRAQARHDRTPDLLGLSGFADAVAAAPEEAPAALAAAVARLGLSEAMLPLFFHRLLVDMSGWAQVARYRLWQAELAGGGDATAVELLAIRAFWEARLFEAHGTGIGSTWLEARRAYAEPPRASAEDAIDTILQEAAERAAQRRLIAALDDPAPVHGVAPVRPAVQAVFCIDVRSEVFRRRLESLDPRIATVGFAGFFGVALAHRRAASDEAEARCPVLLSPTLATQARGASDADQRIAARARRAWTRFQTAAVSSFTFVEAAGPAYAFKLARDALRLGATAADAALEPAPQPAATMSLEARVEAGETILRAMSLTGDFARLVVLAGHGAGVVNNPHASALHCGACGGYQGDANARLVAALLNDGEVRAGLAARGIVVPADTLFVGALHDTTSDEITLFDADLPPGGSHEADLAQLRGWLASAGRLARTERALRLPAASAEMLRGRGRDWSEVRPEWALAGCNAFIAAPRARTEGRDLGGRAFLHSYAWRDDVGFRVLELIMTAPVVVASWISLQYYGSTVAPELFGGGNKLLHNVVGGIGVVEGNGGKLRAGLPWQSVHDGERLVHEPLRLTVAIEAPRAAMSDIISRHPMLQALFDNRWLHLLAIDNAGRVAWRYAGKLTWDPVDGVPLRAAG